MITLKIILLSYWYIGEVEFLRSVSAVAFGKVNDMLYSLNVDSFMLSKFRNLDMKSQRNL